jgi:hypothetical protein
MMMILPFLKGGQYPGMGGQYDPEYAVNKIEAIEEHRKYAKTYPNPQSTIFSETIKTNIDFDGSITVSLKISNTIKKESWDKSRTFDFDMFVRFNKDIKINSVFTSIIK